MSTEEVARKVVELTRRQAWREALDTLYADEIVSVEAHGMGGESPEKRGIEAIRAKTDWWINNMTVYDIKVAEPFVAHDRFVVLYDLEFGEKNSDK
ncbi:MAG TPA: SnoaL-like domain-containing protein [Chthoniobacterales bacterium]|nr:SnoaL-like domain-containing protein [Chthoniobacterales bacterium]